MRTIKYRAWFDGKMYFVTELMFNSTGVYIATLTNTDAREIYHYQTNDIRTIELMQYTGFKDVEKKEIYEGDILGMENATAKVVFWERPPEFGLDFHHNESEWCEDWNLTDDGCVMEIIGNVWEHPELLEVK